MCYPGTGLKSRKVTSALNGLAQCIIRRAGNDHVPLPPSIEPSVLIQGAMDNFDHEENTSSGIGGSHDTILVLFQNCQNANEQNVVKSSKAPNADNKLVKSILNCLCVIYRVEDRFQPTLGQQIPLMRKN